MWSINFKNTNIVEPRNLTHSNVGVYYSEDKKTKYFPIGNGKFVRINHKFNEVINWTDCPKLLYKEEEPSEIYSITDIQFIPGVYKIKVSEEAKLIIIQSGERYYYFEYHSSILSQVIPDYHSSTTFTRLPLTCDIQFST